MLSECLDSLRQQVFQHFSVILVDNGSNDGSINFVNRHYPEVKTIALPKNLGFAAANNIAIKSVNTGYVALLNNDAVPHPLWLQSLIEALGSHPEAGFAASKMLFYDNPETIDRAGDAYTRAGQVFYMDGASPQAIIIIRNGFLEPVLELLFIA